MNRREAASLLVSGLAITGGILSAYLTSGVTLVSPEILGEGLKAFGGLGGGIVGNSFQKHFIDKHPQDDVIKNGDLTWAIGKAIFELCADYAKNVNDKSDKKSLQKLSETPLEDWENLIIGGEYVEGEGLIINSLDLDEVSAEKSVQYLHAQSDKLDEITALTPEIWESVIGRLCQKHKCSLSKTAKTELAEKLFKEFARALRKVLIADFSKDGKAYASMQFRLLSETLHYAKENYELNDQILKLVVDTNIKVDELIKKSPNHYSPESDENFEKWQSIFKSFDDTLDEIKSDIKEIKSDTKEIKSDVKQLLANQPKREILEPKGFVNSPREPNDFFVEQSDIFARLDEHLGKYHIGYLHGTHGLGKTTTVCEYGFSRANDYEFIFYVLAADNTIINEMAQLADRYVETVSVEDAPEQKALKLTNYLKENSRWEKENKNWLIIFDNLESKEPIEKYFLKKNKGDILYTCNEKLFIGNDREVDFEEFLQTEAELFLYQKVNVKKDAEHKDISANELKEIQKVISILGKIPLSLNIAGSNIRETRVSYDDYVGLIKANINKHLKYKDSFGQYQNDTIFNAFSISLDKIKEFDATDEDGETVAKLAEIFLYLCSFCAPEDIPEELIEKTLFNAVETTNSATPPKILFRETVKLLKKFDLIKEKQKPFRYKEKFDEPQTLADGTKAHWAERETVINVFDTYRTLQNVLSVKLEDETKKSLLEKLIVIFDDLLPYSEFTTWEIFGKYVLHAFSITEKAKTLTIQNPKTWRVCNEMGVYLRDIAQYTQSENLYLYGKTIAENIYGKGHENTATSYNNLATLYYSQGNYKDAEPLYRKALSIIENPFGFYDPRIASSCDNLAIIYKSQGKPIEAESLYQKALSIRIKVLGNNDPDTAKSHNNLAMFYKSQANYEKSESHYRKAFLIYENIQFINHPDAAASYYNFGVLCYRQSKL